MEDDIRIFPHQLFDNDKLKNVQLKYIAVTLHTLYTAAANPPDF